MDDPRHSSDHGSLGALAIRLEEIQTPGRSSDGPVVRWQAINWRPGAARVAIRDVGLNEW